MFLIKIPTSQGGMNKTGSEKAPNAIADAITDFYTNEEGQKPKFVIDEVQIAKNNLEETNAMIEKKASETIGNKAIFLGGDHSITYPLFRAFSKKYKNPGIIIFDAHPDCVNHFHPPSHEDWLRTLIEDKIVNPKNVVLVAVRNIDETESIFLKKSRIRVFTARQLFNTENACDSIMESMHGCDGLYVSIDIDAVDPAFAPGTGYTEPAGITSRQLLYFASRLKKMKNFRWADIVEVNPEKDINNMTVKLAAKTAAEFW